MSFYKLPLVHCNESSMNCLQLKLEDKVTKRILALAKSFQLKPIDYC